jgi:NADH-quinone oxidoreductase subunit A
MDQYLPLLLLAVLALMFAVGSLVASRMLAPNGRLNPAKSGPYESGIAPRRRPAPRFPVRFYLVAMIFVIFDIEIVFLYPFAVMFHQLWKFGVVEMGSFAVVVFIAFAYLVSEGALDWGPAKRLGARTGAPIARSLNATVRRVSRPGLAEAPRPTVTPGAKALSAPKVGAAPRAGAAPKPATSTAQAGDQ